MPADGPPAAAVAVVYPCREDSDFPDRATAGVGVMWLVMNAVRGALIERGLLASDAPMLRHLLDLVAVGTVADAVSLASPVNRWIVQHGLSPRRGRRAWVGGGPLGPPLRWRRATHSHKAS